MEVSVRRAILNYSEDMFQHPDLSSAKVARLRQGDKISVLGEEKNFYHVRLEVGTNRGMTGYVGKSAVLFEDEERQPFGVAAVPQRERRATRVSKRARIKYTGSGTSILGWYIISFILILITLGIYTPWAVNNLYRYLFEHCEIEIPD